MTPSWLKYISYWIQVHFSIKNPSNSFHVVLLTTAEHCWVSKGVAEHHWALMSVTESHWKLLYSKPITYIFVDSIIEKMKFWFSCYLSRVFRLFNRLKTSIKRNWYVTWYILYQSAVGARVLSFLCMSVISAERLLFDDDPPLNFSFSRSQELYCTPFKNTLKCPKGCSMLNSTFLKIIVLASLTPCNQFDYTG